VLIIVNIHVFLSSVIIYNLYYVGYYVSINVFLSVPLMNFRFMDGVKKRASFLKHGVWSSSCRLTVLPCSRSGAANGSRSQTL
jgi:hypothetical protein